MLRARRRFLDTGAYAPLRDAVREEVERALAESGIGSGCVVEAGCGDGYYIGQLAAEHPAPAGLVPVMWNGFDLAGRKAGSGVYWVRADAAGETFSRRLVLAR